MWYWHVLGYLPAAMALAGLVIWTRVRARWKGTPPLPVNTKLLRGPGESLRAKLEQIDEQAFWPIACLALTGWPLGVVTDQVMRLKEPLRTQMLIGYWAVGGMVSVAATAWLLALLRNRLNYNLGLSGERAVGEELNKLMLQGLYVFHDFPAGDWNIDHVVVGPPGVFVVETKTYRKRKSVGPDYYKVFYDGRNLRFGGKEKAPKTGELEQTKAAADWLKKFLKKSAAENVPVNKILTFPGWFVVRQVKEADVYVCNHEEIGAHLWQNCVVKLSREQVQRCVFQIEQRCRTVEL